MDMQTNIQKLDADIQAKHPTGILVSPELYDELEKRGRISRRPSVLGPQDMLDGTIPVSLSSLPAGEYRLPGQKQ